MATPSNDVLLSSIKELLKGADLQTLSSKKIRKELEAKYSIDLTQRKQEIDDMVMTVINAHNQSGGVSEQESNNATTANASQNGTADADSNDSEASGEETDDGNDDDSAMRKNSEKVSKKKSKSADAESGSESSDDDDDDQEIDDELIARQLQQKEFDTRKRSGKKTRVDKSLRATRTSVGTQNRNSGFVHPVVLSDELKGLLKVDSMPRNEVTKTVWALIKERNLQDPTNRQFIICDEEFERIFKVKKFRGFGMQKLLAPHLHKSNETAAKRKKPAPKNNDGEILASNSSAESDAGENNADEDDEPRPKKRKTATEKTPKAGAKKGGGTAWTRPLMLSEQLQKVVEAESLPKHEVVKKIWSYIKEHELQNPKNKQFVICDEPLVELFKVKSFRGFGMMKLLSKHMWKPEDIE